VRVLSIDGGGIRGIIPAIVLAAIEQRTGRPVATLFDLMAGTSTGGILAAALARPGDDGSPRFAARELIGLYEAEGPEIFDRSLAKQVRSVGGLIDERYDAGGLERALERYLGEARLSESLTGVFITAYDIEARAAFFFRSSRASNDPADDYTLASAARATAAAPTYFEPARVTDVAGRATRALIDGGVFATNPAMCAFAEVARAGREDELDLVVSLGTGSHTDALRYDDVRSWGSLEWARPIIDVVFDGVADTVDFQLAQLLDDGRYVRLQTPLESASDALDDASERNIAALRREGELLVQRRSADIDALCAELVRSG
jgi:patatin-like phospholipase/acyl hydrolase